MPLSLKLSHDVSQVLLQALRVGLLTKHSLGGHPVSFFAQALAECLPRLLVQKSSIKLGKSRLMSHAIAP
ncbi:hypothetical protein [Candidatus Methylacidiphilum infernorum]|uniref:Uncharacterized protein n=1 Tax=Methylacidiphilum infernorum (isolate V4) TaxID=481448 RepID=B3DZ67_METI4|nr:hypothetical protein [Candidatus Methylacidiphilum infernorum]ACD84159.1 Hypothetical protein Minf_2105 [Methylacidiphilum infernorum V4]